MEQKNNVNKPDNFIKYFKEVKEVYGTVEYVIGVTFGVDFEKWREILDVLLENKEDKKDRAFLFTDRVMITDSNPRRDLLKGSLKYCVPKVNGFLHTKFVLIKLKNQDKYIMVVMTKNIVGTGSYDCAIPLVSKGDTPSETGDKQKKECENLSGKKVTDYIEYLSSKRSSDDKLCDKLNEIKGWIKSLEKQRFISGYEGWELKDFQIAYDENRFTNELWEKMLSCDLMVSPFLDVDTVKEIENKKNGSDIESPKILAYPSHIKKVIDEGSGVNYYTGKLNERKASQNMFHAKMYFKHDGNIMMLGSANLTKYAKDNHCEIMLELEAKSDEYYKNAHGFFDEEAMIEKYDDKKIYIDNNDELDETSESFNVERDFIYVKKINDNTRNKYELHILKKDKDIIWGEPYENAVYYVIGKWDKMVCVDKSIYLSDNEVEKKNKQPDYNGDIYTYDEYEQLVNYYLKEFIKVSDYDVLRGRRIPSNPSQKGGIREEAGGKRLEQIPCLYRTIYQKLEEKRGREQTPTLKDIKNVLEEIYDSIYDENNKDLIKAMLDKLLKE